MPFNVGRAIQLYRFKIHETSPLSRGLQGKVDNPQVVMQAVLSWTGGQPFLTQKLCQLLVNYLSQNSIPKSSLQTNPLPASFLIEEWVKSIVKYQIIKNWESQDEPPHLKTIRDRIVYGLWVG